MKITVQMKVPGGYSIQVLDYPHMRITSIDTNDDDITIVMDNEVRPSIVKVSQS